MAKIVKYVINYTYLLKLRYGVGVIQGRSSSSFITFHDTLDPYLSTTVCRKTIIMDDVSTAKAATNFNFTTHTVRHTGLQNCSSSA